MAWVSSVCSRPSHMIWVRKRRLVAGSGRRNSDSSAALAKPWGSATAVKVNSAPAGTACPTRMRPRSSSTL